MANNNYKPTQTSFGRVFAIEGRARVDHTPSYMSSLKLTGISQNFGDITKIEMPSPTEYGKFIEVGNFRGASERATTSLVGRYAAAIKSFILELARNGCPSDVQFHIGSCTDPSSFNIFEKAIIMEDVVITSYSTEDLGALASDEQGKVDETAEISIKDVYEVLPMKFAAKAGDVITNEIVDVVISDSVSCGSCGTESNGCEVIYAVTKAAGGSPGTPPDLVFSLDQSNFYAHDIDSLTSAQDPSGVAGVGSYIVVIADTVGKQLNYCLKTDISSGIDPTFTTVTTGFVTAGLPNAIFSLGQTAFIVGDDGYVYLCSDPTEGVEVLDAGSATIDDLTCVYAFSEYYAVAGGLNGAVVYTTNQVDWSASPAKPVGVGVNINDITMRTATEWWVAASDGKFYYTLDSGVTWTAKAMPGTAPTTASKIAFSTLSVGFASAVVSGHGKLFRTFDAGESWVVLPENGGSIPLSDSLGAMAVCVHDPNFVVAAGLGDDGSDGVLILGKVSG
jgi:hypothetical protein